MTTEQNRGLHWCWELGSLMKVFCILMSVTWTLVAKMSTDIKTKQNSSVNNHRRLVYTAGV